MGDESVKMSDYGSSSRMPLNADTIQTFVVDACGGDLELVLKIIGFFLDSATNLIVEMETGVTAQDWPAVRRVAHSLKTSSRMFSAETLSALCATTEQKVVSEEGSGIADSFLPRIRSEVVWLTAELPTFCRGMLA